MELLKKYYEDICKRRQQELKDLYTEKHEVKYRWQDIVAEEKRMQK
ncbi:MAG: hypothetical protein ACK5MV_08815 [Aminipila sp.]